VRGTAPTGCGAEFSERHRAGHRRRAEPAYRAGAEGRLRRLAPSPAGSRCPRVRAGRAARVRVRLPVGV